MLKYLLTGALLLTAGVPALASDVAATIIAAERAALDRSDKGDVSAFLKLSAPDIVYQDSSTQKPIIGIAALTTYYASYPTDSGSRGTMSNEKVQVMGDIAVLSFHYVSHIGMDRDWNCTEVYRKSAQGWQIVNTHWSLTKPLQQALN